ncbi:YqcC family protein [Pseudomonas sp. SJZ079]|uniref:YqcC family protein n=1 Tax=Pseudomonas sp. SJZ079 TaxID=2572887 RepID=UPI0011BE4028|nr:YqcC family protein [Pseudomonas sp. SJZ079]
MKIFDIFKKTRSEKSQRVTTKLDEVESEMKRIGFWSPSPPEFKVNNYLEAPSFELWLQCVFIPNARKAAKEESYPKDSQVGQMAMRQYDYHSVVEEAQALLQLLNEFDSIIRTK